MSTVGGPGVNSYILPVPKSDLFRILVPTKQDIEGDNSIKGATYSILRAINERLKDILPNEPSLNLFLGGEKRRGNKDPNLTTTTTTENTPLNIFPEFHELGEINTTSVNTSSQKFDWKEFEQNVVTKVKEKYGFMDKYKKAIFYITEHNDLFSKGGNLETVSLRDLDALIQLHSYYSCALGNVLGFLELDQNQGENHELEESSIHNLFSIPQTSFQSKNQCLVSLDNTKLRNIMSIGDIIEIPKINSWEGGIGSYSLVVEVMITYYNLSCLLAVKQLRCYRLGISSNDVNNMHAGQDSNISTWEGLENNSDFFRNQEKTALLTNIQNNTLWVFSNVKPPTIWINDPKFYEQSSSPTNRSVKNFGLDVTGKSDTYNLFRWCQPNFFTDHDLRLYECTPSSDKFLVDPSITKPNLDILYTPVMTYEKERLYNKLDGGRLRKYHQMKYSLTNHEKYLNTIFKCSKSTAELKPTNGKARCWSYIEGLTKSVYYMRKVESISRFLPSRDFVSKSMVTPPPDNRHYHQVKGVNRNTRRVGDLAFILSVSNLTLFRMLLEKIAKLIHLEIARYTVLDNYFTEKGTKSNSSSSSVKRWEYCYAFVSDCSKKADGESQILRKSLYHLQLDSIQCWSTSMFFESRVKIPWNLHSCSSKEFSLSSFKIFHPTLRINKEDVKTVTLKKVDEIVSTTKTNAKNFWQELTNEVVENATKFNQHQQQQQQTQSNECLSSDYIITDQIKCEGQNQLNDASVSDVVVWNSLLLTNYYRFLMGYIEYLHRYVLGLHWAVLGEVSSFDPNSPHYVDTDQAREQFSSSFNDTMDFFQRSLYLSEVQIPVSWHYMTCEPGSCNPFSSEFYPLSEKKVSESLNLSTNNQNLPNGKSPILILSACCFLTEKSYSYVDFFNQTYLFAGSLINCACKLAMIPQKENGDPRSPRLTKIAESIPATKQFLSFKSMRKEKSEENIRSDLHSGFSFDVVKESARRCSRDYKILIVNKIRNEETTPVSTPSAHIVTNVNNNKDIKNTMNQGTGPVFSILSSRKTTGKSVTIESQPNKTLLQELLDSENEKNYCVIAFLIGVCELTLENKGPLSILSRNITADGCSKSKISGKSLSISNALYDYIIRHYEINGGLSKLDEDVENRLNVTTNQGNEDLRLSQPKFSNSGEKTHSFILSMVPVETLVMTKVLWIKKMNLQVPFFGDF